MGLFDKKYCNICGEKIGLLGNRKLEDGNLCKNCAKKLSPWFSERRNSTVEEIREQLDWREANRERAAQFRTTRTFGEGTKLLLDETHGWFTITRSTDLAEDNPDVLDISAITGCRTDIDERRTELKMETQDSDGKIVRKSYSPPRYEYDYDFRIIVSVNVPFYSEMKFQMNIQPINVPSFLLSSHQEPMHDSYYRSYRETCDELCDLLERMRTGGGSSQPTGAPAQGDPSIAALIPGISSSPAAEKAVAEVIQHGTWTCASCQWPNHGTVTCQHCGKPLSDEKFLATLKELAFAAAMGEDAMSGGGAMPTAAPVQNSAAPQSWNCPSCGAANQGKFCESCGTKRP